MYLCIATIFSMLFAVFFSSQSNFLLFCIYNHFDVFTILFLLVMYVAFYVVHFFIEKKLSVKGLVGKDLIFLVLKFLIPLFYALIRQSKIENEADRKTFLLHFLVYAIIFFILDSIIYYKIINNKKDG